SSTIALDTAGCDTLRRLAALPMLPVSITAISMSKSRSLRRRLVRSLQGIVDTFPIVMRSCYNHSIHSWSRKLDSVSPTDMENMPAAFRGPASHGTQGGSQPWIDVHF